ncbi:hypothetical protein [Halobacterium sp. KA-6]|uniref:hypothetical protein n=1 Tax=Halobacterium sp. KA-6 TaxID=2896368 RepID=UPI001E359043|nr:hypothetical protein [Halobacterium sp. KA-6]MCD2205299.1 hypothetical protein [Halobacterium sp. KA-6]
MKDSIRTALAVAAGVMLVATATLGGVAGPGSSPVGTAEAQPLAGCEVAQFGPVVVSDVTGLFCNTPDTDKLTGLDAQETKQSIYDQASIQKANNELTQTAYSNYLSDTESIALMEGKNAYIRALENGANESVATQKAQDAVADYYAVKQKNLLASWNITATVFNSSYQTAQNTTNVSANFVTYNGSTNTGMSFYELETANVTLTNGTTTQSLEYVFGINYQYAGPVRADVTTGEDSDTHDTGSESYTGTLRGVDVKPPNESLDRLNLAYFPDYADRWTEIESQNSDVQNQVKSFVNATYSEYQQGEINSSDLVDPYLGAREYDPQNSSSWTLRSLSSMGIEPPENLSNIGRMNVSVNNTTYTGTLMSDGTPEGGYQVGGTYDAANITGAQFVALDDGGSRELNGEFTLESVTTADGKELAENETVAYKEINYSVANISEFKALQEDLDRLSAEINAKQQQERNSGGGGILPDFGSGGAIPGAVLLGGAVVLLLNRA